MSSQSYVAPEPSPVVKPWIDHLVSLHGKPVVVQTGSGLWCGVLRWVSFSNLSSLLQTESGEIVALGPALWIRLQSANERKSQPANDRPEERQQQKNTEKLP